MNPLLKAKLPITEEPKKTGKLYFINKKEIKKNLSKSTSKQKSEKMLIITKQ